MRYVRRADWLPLIGFVVLSLGLLGLSLLAALQFRTDDRIQSGPRVYALVRDVDETEPGEANLSWLTSVDVRFRTKTGQTVQTTIERAGHGLDYAPGQEIPIRYDPRHPTHAEADRARQGSWLLVLAPLGLALAFGAVAAHMWRSYRQDLRDDLFIEARERGSA